MNWFLNFFRPAAAQRLLIQAQDIRDALAYQLGLAKVEMEPQHLHVFDHEYVSVTHYEAWRAANDESAIWMPETDDCDDFAWLIRARILNRQRDGFYGPYAAAFGFITVPGHALNWFIDGVGTIWLLDNDGQVLPLSSIAIDHQGRVNLALI